jgi:hypothetical protein
MQAITLFSRSSNLGPELFKPLPFRSTLQAVINLVNAGLEVKEEI